MERGVGGDLLWIARELERLASEGEAGTLALVIRTRGSAPGRVGAKMVVLPDGRIRGTVGGGSVERLAVDRRAVPYQLVQTGVEQRDGDLLWLRQARRRPRHAWQYSVAMGHAPPRTQLGDEDRKQAESEDTA